MADALAPVQRNAMADVLAPVQHARVDAEMQEMFESWNSATGLVHRIQRERGATCSWIATSGSVQTESVPLMPSAHSLVLDFRKRTNTCIAAGKRRISPSAAAKLREVRELADPAGSVRSESSLASRPALDLARRFCLVFTGYTELINDMLSDGIFKRDAGCAARRHVRGAGLGSGGPGATDATCPPGPFPAPKACPRPPHSAPRARGCFEAASFSPHRRLTHPAPRIPGAQAPYEAGVAQGAVRSAAWAAHLALPPVGGVHFMVPAQSGSGGHTIAAAGAKVGRPGIGAADIRARNRCNRRTGKRVRNRSNRHRADGAMPGGGEAGIGAEAGVGVGATAAFVLRRGHAWVFFFPPQPTPLGNRDTLGGYRRYRSSEGEDGGRALGGGRYAGRGAA